MNSEDHQDRLVDLLLWESVGAESPPDVRSRVLDRVNEPADEVIAVPRPVAPVVPLPSARRSRLPVLAIAASLVVLGVAAVLIQTRLIANARTPVVVSVTGAADFLGGPVDAGEELTTGPDSDAVLQYPDGTRVELAERTTVVIPERSLWDRSKGVELRKGMISADVAPQGGDRPMVLTARGARAVVVGTKLSFWCAPDRIRLEVEEGAVEFKDRVAGSTILVETGSYAEARKGGVRTGLIQATPVFGITRFTLMNADTDKPMRDEPLRDGEKISLSSLPTRNINIRADFEGDPPNSVMISLKRHLGKPTGLAPHLSKPHQHAPFFVAGDHWAEGRPEDCVAWVPPAGLYHLSAEAVYEDVEKQARSAAVKIKFWIIE